MPKSRNRGRPQARQTPPQQRQRKWVKWLAILPLLALLGATLLGFFGSGVGGR